MNFEKVNFIKREKALRVDDYKNFVFFGEAPRAINSTLLH